MTRKCFVDFDDTKSCLSADGSKLYKLLDEETVGVYCTETGDLIEKSICKPQTEEEKKREVQFAGDGLLFRVRKDKDSAWRYYSLSTAWDIGTHSECEKTEMPEGYHEEGGYPFGDTYRM